MFKINYSFRAWDDKDKKWLLGFEYPGLGGFSLYGETILFGEWSGVINRFILNQRDREPKHLIVTRSTTLEDRDGKVVYAGDMLEEKIGVNIVRYLVMDEGFRFFALILPVEKEKERIKEINSVNFFENSIIVGNMFDSPGLLLD